MLLSVGGCCYCRCILLCLFGLIVLLHVILIWFMFVVQ